MTNATTTQTETETQLQWWEKDGTVQNYGCRECARFHFGQGYRDRECERHVVAHMRAVVAKFRAAWLAGDDARTFLDLVSHTPHHFMFINWGSRDNLWALAMIMMYRDKPQWVIDQAIEKIPIYIDCLERDVLHFAGDRGVVPYGSSRWPDYNPDALTG